MSFSSDVKEELEKHISQARHCSIAEMAAYVINCSDVYDENRSDGLTFYSESKGLIGKIQLLLKKVYGVDGQISTIKQRQETFCIKIDNEDEILKSIKFDNNVDRKVSHLIIKNSCCKRAFLQGSFTVMGSMTSPEKGYHLEFVSSFQPQLQQIKEIIASFDIEAKITSRKKNYILYVKEGSSIVDLLNVMNAHVSLMNMENTIILKDMRNDVNRKVNCETANIIKSINAASRQVEDIEYIKSKGELKSLPEALRQMAEVRLAYPETPLKDLGSLLDPPVGKSGVNHRLRRLSEIAEELRQNS